MNNPKSSFWGTISFIGLKGKDKPRVLVVIASHEFYIRSDDPAIKYLRVTSGSKKPLVIREQIDIDPETYRIYAVFQNVDRRQSTIIQDILRESTGKESLPFKDGSTEVDREIADECPDYHLYTLRKSKKKAD